MDDTNYERTDSRLLASDLLHEQYKRKLIFMNFDLVLLNGEIVVFQNGVLRRAHAHIGISNGRISKISSNTLHGKQEIDVTHLTVLPGVIDTQVHFREPGLTHKEDLESGTRSAALGGVTSVFEMPNTNPPTVSLSDLQAKFRLAKDRAWVNYAFYVGASHDNIGELATLEQTPGCSGIKIFMGSSFGSLLVDNESDLELILKNGTRRVIVHAEDELRLKERKSIATESKTVTKHHIWRDPQTSLIATTKLLQVARKVGRKVHVLHVTTKEEVSLLEKNKDIASFEITPNHLSFVAPDCYERLGSLVQMNPPIRELEHQQALWKAVQNGSADIIGTDHAPHTKEEKSKEYPSSPSGIPGVQTLVPVMLNHIHQGKLSLERFVELTCENPRKVFGCQSKGRIEEGLDADFTLVDLKKERIIENKWIASKCGWTPFDGMKVTGFPTHTIIDGKIIMQEDTLLQPGLGTKILFT